VAHELGDQDQVVTRTDQAGPEGVAQDVAGKRLLEPGLAEEPVIIGELRPLRGEATA
jgi:hypothetical protein